MFDWLLTHSPLLYLTQSFWRDEAFSVLVAEYGWVEIIKLTVNDFTPPLYYFLLKIWMMIFGRSEVAVRMLSFIFHTGTVIMTYRFAKDVIKIKHTWFPLVATLLVAINPLLVYYAFEARVYSLVVFFVLCSLYFFIKNQTRPYIIFSLLAIYAHPYSILALMAQAVYVFLWNKPFIKEFIKRSLIIGLFYLPWIFAILYQITRSSEMWYYPVTGELIAALLGSMYAGFEGTPGDLWGWMIAVSAVIAGVILKGYRNKNVKDIYRLLLFTLLLPLVVVIGISVFKPIYTQRYLIFTTIAEVLLVAMGLFSIYSNKIRAAAIITVISATTMFLFWFPAQHPKRDFRSPFNEINQQFESGDIILNDSALTFFESLYYASDQRSVYLLKEDDLPLPPYVGAILIPSTKWAYEIPSDRRVFMIYEDGSYEIYYPTV